MQGTNKTTSKLEFQNGRPVFEVNGKLISYAAYSDPCTNPGMYTPEQWVARLKDFVDSGVHTFTIQPEYSLKGEFGESPFWTADGIYPDIDPEKYFCVDRQAKAVLDLDPEAKIIVRFGDFVPIDWITANPDHVQAGWNGRVQDKQPSLASEKALKDVCKLLERIVEYCESRPWAERVIGYLYYPMGEGITNLNVEGYFYDVSPIMQQAFRIWVRKKYVDEQSLREAWGNPYLTFDAVSVPNDEEWIREREQVLHWPEGNELQKMRDYLMLQRELFMRWYKTVTRKMKELLSKRPVLFGIDMAKQSMLGWQIRMAFYGKGPGADFLNIISATGGIDIGELLDEEGLDLLVTPADYTARTVGYGWESEGIADSLLLRGKTIYVENDCRTFNEGQENYTLGAFNTPEEVRAGMLRNAAWSLTRGHIDYWMISGGQYFHHPVVQEKGVQAVVPLLDRAPHWPHLETEHAVAMIIDDTSPLYEDGTSGYQNLAVLWQRTIGLAHSGVPYRIYLFSDLERENMPDYRCYLFPNLFKMDEHRMEVLNRKIFRDGRIAIFGPSTGITGGTGLSAEWASRVLGVEMELVRKHSPRRVIINGYTPITDRLPAATTYGDSQHYGPILIPSKGAVEAAGGIVLGEATTFFGINRPGLFVKDYEGKYKIAWSVAVPLPGNLIRELARYGGCHVWCEDDDVVLASDKIAALHSIKSGTRTIKFPAPRTVWDLLTRERIGRNLSDLTLHVHAPETRLFYFGEESPY